MAIMQPYAFPYIGYFHLIEASDLFVFYDDVNYITRGWINRNRILLNGKDYLFTIPIAKASRNKLINETELAIDNLWRDKFNRTVTETYQKAPYFPIVTDLISSVFSKSYPSVSDLAINSIASIYSYLETPFNYTKSSVCSPKTKGEDKTERLIKITKEQGFNGYVNTVGGKSLYAKEYFKANGIELGFVESEYVQYRQYSNTFVPWLSILDVLMFNEPMVIKNYLKMYKIT